MDCESHHCWQLKFKSHMRASKRYQFVLLNAINSLLFILLLTFRAKTWLLQHDLRDVIPESIFYYITLKSQIEEI